MFALKPKRKDCGKDSACIFGYRESFFELPAQPGVFDIQRDKGSPAKNRTALIGILYNEEKVKH
jgi:hypothetical protein